MDCGRWLDPLPLLWYSLDLIPSKTVAPQFILSCSWCGFWTGAHFQKWCLMQSKIKSGTVLEVIGFTLLSVLTLCSMLHGWLSIWDNSFIVEHSWDGLAVVSHSHVGNCFFGWNCFLRLWCKLHFSLSFVATHCRSGGSDITLPGHIHVPHCSGVKSFGWLLDFLHEVGRDFFEKSWPHRPRQFTNSIVYSDEARCGAFYRAGSEGACKSQGGFARKGTWWSRRWQRGCYRIDPGRTHSHKLRSRLCCERQSLNSKAFKGYRYMITVDSNGLNCRHGDRLSVFHWRLKRECQ